jgi:hypothetical protein
LPPRAEFDVHLGYRFNGVRVAATFDFGLRPDHFTFIAVRDFHDHDFAHHRLPPTEVTRIYNHTTVINNYEVHNNIVVNQGIKPDRVAAATHTEIRKVAIRDVPSGAAAAAAAHGGAKAEAAVYRPQLRPSPVRPANMVAQKVDSRHPVIQHPPVAPTLAATSANANRGNNARPSQGAAYPGRGQQTPATTARPGNTSPYEAQQNQRLNRQGSQPITRPATETPSRPPVANAQTAPNRPTYPLRSTQPNQADAYRPNSAQNPQTYYPKGYYQSGGARGGGPQMDARPSESRGQNPRNSENDNRGRGNRKNDQ